MATVVQGPSSAEEDVLAFDVGGGGTTLRI